MPLRAIACERHPDGEVLACRVSVMGPPADTATCLAAPTFMAGFLRT